MKILFLSVSGNNFLRDTNNFLSRGNYFHWFCKSECIINDIAIHLIYPLHYRNCKISLNIQKKISWNIWIDISDSMVTYSLYFRQKSKYEAYILNCVFWQTGKRDLDFLFKYGFYSALPVFGNLTASTHCPPRYPPVFSVTLGLWKCIWKVMASLWKPQELPVHTLSRLNFPPFYFSYIFIPYQYCICKFRPKIKDRTLY